MTRSPHYLDRRSLPMRLWRNATRTVWVPEQIDFRRDRQEWLGLADHRQERVRRLCSLFHIGERAVTMHLLPLLQVVASEGRLEEEMYLTSFLWEEAKHVDLFDRFFAEVARDHGDPRRYSYERYQRIVEQELEAALTRLHDDRSPEAQVRAAATYNIVVEGIMAETGYHVFRRMLVGYRTLPGMQRAIGLIAKDESRHVAFGVYFLSRLIVEHGDRAYKAFLRRMMELKPLVEASTEEFVGLIEGDDAVRISRDELFRYSQRRFTRRVQRIVRARSEGTPSIAAVSSAERGVSTFDRRSP